METTKEHGLRSSGKGLEWCQKAFKFGPEPQQDAVPNAQQQEGQQQEVGDVEQDENMRRNTVEHTRVHTHSQREEAHAPDMSSVKKHIRELRALGVSVPVNENPGTNEENENVNNNRGSKVLEVEAADNDKAKTIRSIKRAEHVAESTIDGSYFKLLPIEIVS